jgi:hypothetical protein
MRSVLLECTMQLCLGSRTLWARSVSGHAPWGFSVALAGGCRVLVGCQRRSCFSLVRTVCAADIPAVVRLVDSDGDLAGDVQTHPQPTVDEAHVPWPKANRTEVRMSKMLWHVSREVKYAGIPCAGCALLCTPGEDVRLRSGLFDLTSR